MRIPARPHIPLSLLRPVPWASQEPTWRDARPAVIGAALKRALARPAGNWFVAAAAEEVTGRRPTGRTVAGVELVLWRDTAGRVHAGPGACPHLGAPLCLGRIDGGALRCHWHGLALGSGGFPGWAPHPAYDDGLLVWVRLDAAGGEEPTERPAVPQRPAPARSLAAVTAAVAACEPEDVVANRLDPWHGAWFHPYSFAELTVVGAPDEGLDPDAGADADRFVVDVAFRLRGRIGVPVRAVFTAPGPRTVVMRIVSGEGAGSVVETHAVPLSPDAAGRPRTAVVEAVVAHSDRSGFAAARRAAPLLRPLMRRASARLWRDDLAYAERRHLLRTQRRLPG